jgi:hypothetical protein
MHRAIYTITFAALMLTSCFQSPAEPADGPSSPLSSNYPEKGIVHWKSFTGWDEDRISQAAEARMIIFPMAICLSRAGAETIGRIKAINPETKIVGYQGMLCVSELWADSAIVHQATPYETDFHYMVEDRRAVSTTGDELLIWEGLTLLNPFTGGELDTGFPLQAASLTRDS